MSQHNGCNCRKPGCKICFPQFCNPWYNSYYNKPCNPVYPIINNNRRVITTWRVKYLVSNAANQAAHQDVNLVNPWGIIIANNEIWVANGTSDSFTNYDLHGNKLSAPVRVRDYQHNSAFPTGLVMNCSSQFPVNSGSVTKPAFLITATEEGTVAVYNPIVDQANSFVVINQTLTGNVVVYKGLALANGFLYCADFFNGKIDVFDGNYVLQNNFPFVDLDTSNPIPSDYGQNNIVHIGCYMYVLYTRRDPNIPVHDMDGPGNGYISVFNVDGTFVRRFHSKGQLNSPWAMIPAPCECGIPKDSFLVGNNGDGNINIFDCAGIFLGKILGPAGLPVVIEGLWGLAPYYKCANEIFFASAPGGNENDEGLVGSFVVDQVLTI